MSSVVAAGFARSEALQQEWNALKTEMDALVAALSRKKDEKRIERKIEIERRMHKITQEMTAMLEAARKEVPSMSSRTESEDAVEEEDQSLICHEQKLPRHVVRRTYDSSEEENDDDASPSVSPSKNTKNAVPMSKPETAPVQVSVTALPLEQLFTDSASAADLRESMWREAMARDPTLEYKVLTIDGTRTPTKTNNPDAEAVSHKAISVFGNHRKDKLPKENVNQDSPKTFRGPETPTSSPAKLPTSPADNSELDDDQVDEIRQESLRLEREARKLRLKDERSPKDDHDLEMLSRRLSDLAKQLRAAEKNSPTLRRPDGQRPVPYKDKTKMALEDEEDSSNGKIDLKSPAALWKGSRRVNNQNGESKNSPTEGFPHTVKFKSEYAPASPSVRMKATQPGRPFSKQDVADGTTDESMTAGDLVEEEPYHRYPVSLRKKTMQGLEAGVASFRALSHRIWQEDHGATSATPGATSKNHIRNDETLSASSERTGAAPESSPAMASLFKKLGVKTAPGSSAAAVSHPEQAQAEPSAHHGLRNPYAEVRAKLAQRSEKLGTLNTQSDEMAEGANDLLASVRNLRKRQDKSALR